MRLRDKILKIKALEDALLNKSNKVIDQSEGVRLAEATLSNPRAKSKDKKSAYVRLPAMRGYLAELEAEEKILSDALEVIRSLQEVKK